MKTTDPNEFFKPKSYLGYLVNVLTSGGIWRSLCAFYKKVRKFTLISAIFRWLGIAVVLLEKSAVLLLATTVILLIFPIISAVFTVYLILCAIKYKQIDKNIKSWLEKCEKLTIFITKERIFSKERNLFLRNAIISSSEAKNHTIIVCADRFISAKWYSPSILAARVDYYFVLKRFYFQKISQKTTVIVL